MDNIILEITSDRAEWFVLCEKEFEYIQKCLKYKHKIDRLLNFKQARIFEISNSNIIIDSDPGGNWHNVKVITSEHY